MTTKSVAVGVLAGALTVSAIAVAWPSSPGSSQTEPQTSTSTVEQPGDSVGHVGYGGGPGGAAWRGQGSGSGQGSSSGTGHGSGGANGSGGSAGAVAAELSPEMQAQLVHLTEEEKLAHDLYMLAADTYNVTTFATIATSETRHYSAMTGLLTRNGLDLPASLDDTGTFSEDSLQTLYGELAPQVEHSLAAAAAVGVQVETADIADLQSVLDDDPPADVARVVSNLLRASQQHLAAFERLQETV